MEGRRCKVKKIVFLLICILLLLTSCNHPSVMPDTLPSNLVSATPAPSPPPSPAAATAPSFTPEPFGEVPDSAGRAGVLFDIYHSAALFDLDMDGTADEIEFHAQQTASTLRINEQTYLIDKAGLAPMFAVADIDSADTIREIVLTDAYRADITEGENVYSYLYWWTRSGLIEMGRLLDVKFAGAWRPGLDPQKHFDAAGTVICLARTENFTDIWYDGRYSCNGPDRTLREDAYTADVIGSDTPLLLKKNCVLLKNIDASVFEPDHNALWDDASGTSTLARDYSDEIIAFIPQAGESLQVVCVHGPYWYELRADDGKTGWIKCVENEVQGYAQVMGYDAFDIFDGIIVAG